MDYYLELGNTGVFSLLQHWTISLSLRKDIGLDRKHEEKRVICQISQMLPMLSEPNGSKWKLESIQQGWEKYALSLG